MCKAFSCLVTRGNKVYWKAGLDSHEDLRQLFYGDGENLGENKDGNLCDKMEPPLQTFARIEIVPPNGDYLDVDFGKWVLKIDEKIKPTFFTEKHEDLCREAFIEWTKAAYTFNVEEAKKPINPFKIVPPEKITEEHIALLKKWASVRDSVRVSVWASVGDSVRASVGDSVWGSVRDSVRVSVWASVGDSVWDSVWDSVRDSVGDSVRGSVWASVWAYIGSLFSIKTWKHINYENPLFTKGKYPFQPLVDLWKVGLVPSFDGKIWRLHGGKNGKVLWMGELK